MKIGPLIISRAVHNQQQQPSPRPEFGEIGAPGTLIFGGQMTQTDYNADLQPPTCYDIYDRMRLSDGQVRSAMSVVKLPILRAYWQIKAASDSAEDQEIAEFVEADLKGMTLAFINFLRQALLMLDYGSMLFETVWEVRDDGLVHLRKLAPRLPRTVLRWLVDDTGGFAGIQQSAIKASGYTTPEIPADKLLLFVNEQEGSNFRGVSMLRAAYKHWYFKDGLYRVDAIAKEKRSVGVDVGTIKTGAGEKAAIKTSLERALMTLHAHEKQFIVEDEENYTYRLETGGGARMADALPSIEHHDLRILRSILAEFLAMGSGSTGSLAMHKDKSTFFLMTLEAIADNIAETINSHLIRRWVDYNWRVSDYPRMEYSRMDTRDVAALADAVNKLVSVMALTPSPETEQELRVVLDLPELEETPSPPEDTPEEDGEEPDMAALQEAVRSVQERQLERMRAELARGKDLEGIDVPFRREMAAGVMEAKPELTALQARALANLLADRLRLALAAGREGDIAAADIALGLQAVA